jgi:parvulin-like peptidyl-prolyl isomerase
MAKKTKIALGIVIVVGLLAAGWFFLPGEEPVDESLNPLSGGETVAEVNGEKISSSEVAVTKKMIEDQGQEISEENVIEQIINRKLLTQEVAKKEYSFTDKEAESALEKELSAQNISLEEYKQQLEEQGITYQEQLARIKEELGIQKYLEEEIDLESLEVSEEEKKEFYDSYKDQAGDEEVGSYEEMEPQIAASLVQQKEQQAIVSLIEQLRESAEIKIL